MVNTQEWQYQELWERYHNGQLPQGEIPRPLLASEQDIVKYSLKIDSLLGSIADATDIPKVILKSYFNFGGNLQECLATVAALLRGETEFSDIDRLEASRLIETFELWFEFTTPEELILPDENEEISVLITE